ncbi:MAG: UDP-N-acetylmuramate--L-alanine ligase [Oscillospiraceae bacterium]|jgi:UDP-N-acetylmuramate--alanine ligase|nr:UDP-N-acetylmuramate--L-alanine ligase [Oscillospiraceae bacterium]
MVNLDADEIFSGLKRLHFIGIGGSGMCPIVEILHSTGNYIITGSDVDNESDTVKRIRGMGIPVAIGHRAENIGDAQLLVYSAAIQKDNPELLAAKEAGIHVFERSVMLGVLCRRYPNTIAISGTHGKTTSSSMLAQILVTAGIDPTVFIGGKLPLIGGNGRVGNSDIMVCEACEFVDTFLQITPAIAVILNIDADHLDYFGTLENVIRSFNKFLKQTSSLVVINGDDANSLKALEGVELPVITFGLGENNDYTAKNIRMNEGSHWEFELVHKGTSLADITLQVPGRHNIYNALAAAAAAHVSGAIPQDIVNGLGSFTGAGRRYEVHGVFDGLTVADDYAHHPAEIEVTLKAVKEMHFNKVWAVFQPFTYTRTKNLLQEFANALDIADQVILTEIMPAREVDDLGVSSSQLQERINKPCKLLGSFEEIADYVIANAGSGDLVITMGCGDIYKCAKLIKQKLEAKD